MDTLTAPIPFLRLQLELQGGWQRVLVRAGMLTFGIICVFEVWNRASGRGRLVTVDGMLVLLRGAQPFLLLLGGSNTIYRAFQRDFDTKMLESHRMCPSSGLTMLLGYVFGPPIQILTYCLVIMVAGAIMMIYAGGALNDWLYGHALLFSGSLTALGGLRLQKPVNPSPIIIIGGLVSMLIMLFPGAALILGYTSVISGVGLLSNGQGVPVNACIAQIVLNLITTALVLGLAVRKYRRPDLPVFNGVWGLLLLLYWLAVSAVGLVVIGELSSGPFGQVAASGPSTLATCTLCATVLLAAGVVVSTYYAYKAYRYGIEVRGWNDRMSPDLVAVLATIITMAVLLVPKLPAYGDVFLAIRHMIPLAFTIFLNITIILALFQVFGQRDWLSPRMIVLLATMLMVMPPIAEIIRTQVVLGWVPPDELFKAGSKESLTWVTGFSPLGALGLVLFGTLDKALPGILAVASGTLVLRIVARKVHGTGVHATFRRAA